MNHTDLTEAIFTQVGVPAEACGTFWDRLARANAQLNLAAKSATFSPLSSESTAAQGSSIRHGDLVSVTRRIDLSSTGLTRASPQQRRLSSLLRLEMRPHQLDVLYETILQCAPRIQAQIQRRVREAVVQLQSVLDVFQKLGTSDRFHVSR